MGCVALHKLRASLCDSCKAFMLYGSGALLAHVELPYMTLCCDDCYAYLGLIRSLSTCFDIIGHSVCGQIEDLFPALEAKGGLTGPTYTVFITIDLPPDSSKACNKFSNIFH